MQLFNLPFQSNYQPPIIEQLSLTAEKNDDLSGTSSTEFLFFFTCVKLIYLGTSKISKKHKNCLDTGHTGHVFGTGHENGPPKYTRSGISFCKLVYLYQTLYSGFLIVQVYSYVLLFLIEGFLYPSGKYYYNIFF